MVELTTGYETNLKNNVKRKKDKYRELLRQLDKNFNQVKFINLSISSLGIFAVECSTFLDMLESIGLEYRPDLLVSTSDKHLYVVELTVGFESNLTNNVNRKKAKYKNLIRELDQNFTSVKFINLSVSSLGVFDKECHTFVKMLNELGLDNQHQQYCIRKIISIAIRSTYYIFCCRNKEWTNPELMNI